MPVICIQKLCILDLILPINRLQPLAKASEHAEIRLLRQQELRSLRHKSNCSPTDTHGTELTQPQ